jgi:hypothetical protein
MKKSKLYTTWMNIKQRCYNPNRPDYKYYGRKGIGMCEEWRNSFQSLSDWARSNGYEEALTIDRIDANDDYKPSNCRWVTMNAQANNKGNNHLLTYNGKTQTIAQWARDIGFSPYTITRRINVFRWSTERALTEKPIVGKNQTFQGGGYE